MTKHISDEKLHAMIAKQLSPTTELQARHWAKDQAPATNGFSLNNLYNDVRERKVGGRNFLGHGNWKAYLEEEHGIGKKKK